METIYKIGFVGCGAVYVGQTSRMDERMKEHLSGMRCGRHHCQGLKDAYVAFGCPIFSVIESKDFDVYTDDLVWDSFTLLHATDTWVDEYGELLWDNPAFTDDYTTLIERLEEVGSPEKWRIERERYWMAHYAPNLLNGVIPKSTPLKR
jgi:hypothetical protein